MPPVEMITEPPFTPVELELELLPPVAENCTCPGNIPMVRFDGLVVVEIVPPLRVMVPPAPVSAPLALKDVAAVAPV